MAPARNLGLISGTLSFDEIEGVKTIKRVHAYDGNPISMASELKGLEKLIVVSAVGGLNPDYKVGDFVVIEDLITLFCSSVVSNFQDLSNPFDEQMRNNAEIFLKSQNQPVKRGIHVFMRGPHYESFADKKALRLLGADVVGMSMAPEVILARSEGIRCVGIGVVTNLAFVKHAHEDVIKEANKAIPIIKELAKYEADIS